MPSWPTMPPLLSAIEQDPVLSRRVMIAEPWDIGPGGYQLGAFPARWGEWNDRYRDAVRRYWRGDAGMVGELATNEGIFVDGKTFKIAKGKGTGDPAAAIAKLVEEPLVDAALEAATDRFDIDEQQRLRKRKHDINARLMGMTFFERG